MSRQTKIKTVPGSKKVSLKASKNGKIVSKQNRKSRVKKTRVRSQGNADNGVLKTTLVKQGRVIDNVLFGSANGVSVQKIVERAKADYGMTLTEDRVKTRLNYRIRTGMAAKNGSKFVRTDKRPTYRKELA